MARKKQIETSDLVVFADFELDGKKYHAGDAFVIPADLTLDEAFTDFRNLDRKEGNQMGLAFSKPGEIIDKDTRERAVRVFVLPVVAKE